MQLKAGRIVAQEPLAAPRTLNCSMDSDLLQSRVEECAQRQYLPLKPVRASFSALDCSTESALLYPGVEEEAEAVAVDLPVVVAEHQLAVPS